MARPLLLVLLGLAGLLSFASDAGATTRTGTLEAIHGHRSAGWSSTHELLLGGLRLDVSRVGGPERYAHRLGGRRVRATGTRTRDVLHVRTLRAVGPAPARAAHVLDGAKTVLVVPFDVAGGTAGTRTKASIDAAIFSGPSSLNAYLGENSGGRVSLSGDVLDWVHVTPRSSGPVATTCDELYWLARARDAAIGLGRNPATYDRVIYLSADLPACDFAGEAPVSSTPLGKGTWLFLNDDVTTRVSSHEWGHTYGLMHAASTRCTSGGVAVPLSATCTDVEYGDPYDPMGTASGRWYQAYNRVDLGLLPASGGTQTVTASGRYVIGALAQSATSSRLLRVARPDGTVLGLELRKPYGAFEVFAPDAAATTGVTARVLPSAYACCDEPLTRLIDAHPATTSLGDAALRPGETLSDPSSGATVTVVSVGGDSATVDVVLPAPAAAPAAPAAPVKDPAPVVVPEPTPTVTPTPTPTTTPTTPTTPPAVVVPPVTPPRTPVTNPVAPPVPLGLDLVRRGTRSLTVRVSGACTTCMVSVVAERGGRRLASRSRRGPGTVTLTAARSLKGATVVLRQGGRTLRRRV